MAEELKPVRWVGSAKKYLRCFPAQVRREFGQALYAAQKGETDPAAKPLKGFGGHGIRLMKAASKVTKMDRVTEGSGNVLADLELPNADQELLKARLTLQIARIIKDRGFTQAEAAKILGIQQPHVSALARNRAGNFSVGRLIDFLIALGHDVEITVTPTRKEHGAMSVVFA
jgi:predicted XRE-type DNA-binding protein